MSDAAGVVVHEDDPRNAEPAPGALWDAGAHTPAALFYVRNHGPVPSAGDEPWRLRVDGLVERELDLVVDELRERFAEHEVVATLQCAGARRAELLAVRDIPGEIPWGAGAAGTAAWRGVRLADVLAAAGARDGARHVALEGADTTPRGPFAGSVALADAVRPEVLLAWAMDGAPLEPEHGAPLRAVVPGQIGARSVKWLRRVSVRPEPAESHFQAVAYRLRRPGEAAAPGAGIALGPWPVTCALLRPQDGDRLPAGPVRIAGFALAGGGRAIARVDVSADGGATWRPAELLEDQGAWAWRRFRAVVELAPGPAELVARAWDTAGATQPEHPASVWNPGGYANTAVPRVRVEAT